jgi:predicted dehydrogenase
MALTYEECCDMIAVCEKAGIPLFTAFYRGALPRFLKVKSIVDDGMIGTARAVNIRLFQRPSARDPSGENAVASARALTDLRTSGAKGTGVSPGKV